MSLSERRPCGQQKAKADVIVDVHHHHVDGKYYPGYEDFPAKLVAAMDRRGWTWTCLNGIGPRYHCLGNEDVVRTAERYPDRIVPIGFVDLDERPHTFIDDLKAMGMRGLKIIGTQKRYDHDDYLPFYERAAQHHLPILFHTGFLGGAVQPRPCDQSSDNYRPITLDRIARLFPELPLIAAHMGTMTWYHEAVAVMNHPNVYADTSGGPAAMEADFYRLPLNNRIDWRKVVFGTDSLPDDGHIPFGHLGRLMAELELDEATRRNILGETAARIFGLSEA